ncbi:related to ADP-ribosylation factor [Fusarium torulosum]|uniref:Related to ADP-ribosylation factor n=1 Tax=Fusarium torulosum TaxID=33205 RepID=A0AAE8MBY9_9HYPO|nr:related to ADP-ribosylation factor [Fusarium torulosum]
MISGLDNAGKSTLLANHLCITKDDISIIGKAIYLDVKFCNYDNITFKVLDVGLSRPASFRRRERLHFNEASALVWIIDTNDHERHAEVREELIRTAFHNDGTPVLILANKQDLDGAWTVEQTKNYFVNDISSYYVTRPNAVYGTNLKTGEGLGEAFDWLKETMEGRVNSDADIAEETPVLTEKPLLNSDKVQTKSWDMEHKEWK